MNPADALAAGFVTGRMIDDPAVTLLGDAEGNVNPSDLRFDVQGIGRIRVVVEAITDKPPLPCCRICGRNEGDDVGVIVEGHCGDCRRSWA